MRPRSVSIPPAIDMARFTSGIRAGERAVLARAITLIESKRPDHQQQARQLVQDLLPDTGKAMRVGITHHRGTGTWSSLPHDFELNTEAGFEEVFFYILKGKPMRALQLGRGVWFDNSAVDDVWPIAHETFGTVPMGYHPVVGEPGVNVSYVWVYLAKHARWEKVK